MIAVRRSRELLVLASAIVLGLTACTVTPVPRPQTDVPASVPTPSQEPELAPLGTLSGTVVLRLDDHRGGVVYGPYKPAGGPIAVDFACLGDGNVTVTIVGVAAFPNQCGGAGSSVRDVIDLDRVDPYIVRVDSQGDARWSLGVTEVH